MTLDGKAFDGRVRKRLERVDDVLDREERGKVDAAEFLERALRVLGVCERLRREGGVEGTLVDGVPDVPMMRSVQMRL